MRMIRAWCLVSLAAILALTLPCTGFAQSVGNTYQQSIDVANERMPRDPGAALQAARTAETVASRLGDAGDGKIAEALWLQAEALVRTDSAGQAAPIVERALGLLTATGNERLRGDLLLTRGAIHVEQAQVAAALGDYQLAFRSFQTAGDRRKQAIALISLASLHREGADFASALKYYSQALSTYGGDPAFALSVLNNRGNVLTEMERHVEAALQFERALTEAERLGNQALVSQVLRNLARSYLSSGAIDRADATIRRSRQIAETLGDESGVRQTSSVAARVALERGDVAGALRLVERSFAGVDPTETTLTFRDQHRTAHMVYARAGDSARALVHLTALRRLDEQATQIATSTRAALMSARFDFANQELQIANLKAEELRRNIAFERSRTQFQQVLFAGIAAATLIVLALLAYNLVTVRRSRNKVHAANIELGASNVALEKALAAKTEFLATTSHEIRTPLNGILGMTQVMLADSGLSGVLRDRVGIVHGAGLTMRALVDDILDVAKMETGHLTVSLEPTDLPSMLQEVTRMWEEQAKARGLAFALDMKSAPHWVETDPGRLRQMVYNLLSNALKFTETGGITVRIARAEAMDGPRMRIVVRDTGIGIPAEKQAEIFESFKQVDAGTTRRFGGTGLGLAICRNLAGALGGEIRVESEPDIGSTFTVDLPLREVDAPVGSTSDTSEAALLILDRNPINRSMLRTLLETRAGSVRFAATAADAEAEIAAGTIARLLIDDATIRAEDDPMAVLSRLAKAARGAGVVSAVLWKAPDDEQRAALSATGLDVVIAKPVAGAALADKLFGAKPGTDPLVSQAA